MLPYIQVEATGTTSAAAGGRATPMCPGSRQPAEALHLGPDTPIATIQETLADMEARLVVISAMKRQRLGAVQPQLTELVQQIPVALAGAGATVRLARATGASLLEGDPVTAAERVDDEPR